MTQDEIIELARRAGFRYTGNFSVDKGESLSCFQADLEAFAKLVAEKERKFCIQFLMELHGAQMGSHNYYHYAAQALSQLEGKELPDKFSLTIDKDKPIKKYNG